MQYISFFFTSFCGSVFDSFELISGVLLIVGFAWGCRCSHRTPLHRCSSQASKLPFQVILDQLQRMLFGCLLQGFRSTRLYWSSYTVLPWGSCFSSSTDKWVAAAKISCSCRSSAFLVECSTSSPPRDCRLCALYSGLRWHSYSQRRASAYPGPEE